MELTVYKASAGSGKTYTLTQAYLRQLMQQGTEVRNILAITFTNAATSDMKRKIIATLAEVAPDKLAQVLHHYHDFSIKTIDAFVQNIIKPFAFELGLPRNYTPQIEEDVLAETITERLLDRFGREGYGELSGYLEKFLAQREQNQKSLKISDRIGEVVGMLFQEKSIAGVEKLSSLTEADFRRAIEGMETFCAEMEEKAAATLARAKAVVQAHNLTEKDFHEGKRGLYSWLALERPDMEKFASPTASVRKSVEKGILKKPSAADGELAACYGELAGADYSSYFILKEVQNSIYALALLRQAREILSEIEEKTADIPLSEFNQKIDKALREEGNDFIFERCGTRYRHIFIDEFQDTSRLQWKNLRPLLVNNLAQGNACLVVGDAKQSLYRFRSADMEQFVDLCAGRGQDRELRVDVRTLSGNWRSDKGIIAFNNLFYTFVLEHFSLSRPEIYADHAQFYRNQTGALPDEDPQAVRILQVRNVDKDGARDFYERMLLEVLARHAPGDVAVLCRRNDDCRAVADFLVGKGYRVSTPDSLKLSTHMGVRLLMASLQFLETRHSYYREEVYELAVRLGLWEGGGAGDPDPCGLLIAAAPSQADLYDTLQAVVRFWKMDRHADQYLLAFFDHVQKNNFSRIADLARWYEAYAAKTSLQVQGQDDSVKVMSIHKAKGLEFKVVVMPYITDAGLMNKQLFWAGENELPPAAHLPAALVRYVGKNLKDTALKASIETEKQRIDIDNLNALYVATTRPCHKLYLLNHVKGEDTASGRFSANQAIALFAQAHPQYVEYEEDGHELWEDRVEGIGYMDKQSETPGGAAGSVVLCDLNGSDAKRRGGREVFFDRLMRESALEARKRASAQPRPDAPAALESHPWRDHMHAAPEANPATTPEQAWGNYIHKTLSHIENNKETTLARALRRTQAQYPQFAPRHDEALQTLRQIVTHPRLKTYFDPDNGYTIKTESPIATPERLYIPDRLQLKDTEAVVIDYKTGEPHPSHHEQVKGYLDLLRQMGYPSPRGLLVYTQPLHIEPVR